ncbi:SDR family oxidoreductase [Actinomyces timonensis]|uniref:SDR family oxidoreductase n=1 Tax=Actinomyces timonensis TaxID=1288391 RepID=A0AAU8N3G0_9ACTO
MSRRAAGPPITAPPASPSSPAGAASPSRGAGTRRSRRDAARGELVEAVTGAFPAAPIGRHQRRPIAVVTGATSGIGLAIARDLSRDHDLILMARTRSDLDDLAVALRQHAGTRVRAVAVDLTDDDALAREVASLGLPRLDVLVHSAGVEAPGRVGDLEPSQWRSALDLDLVAVAHLTKLLLPALRVRKGLVVMINSGAGHRSFAGQALYCAAKHGLRALADCLREEERGDLRVTTIYPGRVDTPLLKRLQDGAGEEYRPAEYMTPDSVASAVRVAVDMPQGAAVEDLMVRPSQLT